MWQEASLYRFVYVGEFEKNFDTFKVVHVLRGFIVVREMLTMNQKVQLLLITLFDLQNQFTNAGLAFSCDAWSIWLRTVYTSVRDKETVHEVVALLPRNQKSMIAVLWVIDVHVQVLKTLCLVLTSICHHLPHLQKRPQSPLSESEFFHRAALSVYVHLAPPQAQATVINSQYYW